MSDRESDLEPTSREEGEPSRSNLVRIRLPSGEHEWVTAEAFNLISEKEFLDSDELRRLRRQRNVALTLAALASLLLAAAFAAWWLRGRQAAPVVEAPPPAVVAAPPGVAQPVADEAPRAAGEPAASSAAAAEIEDTVRAWARAWSAQDVDGYLEFYSPGFRVPDGLDRPAWESLRRQRIASPRRIAVTVSDVEATLSGESSAIARFGQGYRAPGYRDWVLKTLELRREAGRWRIVEERSALIEAAGAPGEDSRGED